MLRRKDNPAVAAADVDFFRLSALDSLPELRQFTDAVDEIGEELHVVERSIPALASRLHAAWRGHAGSTMPLHEQAVPPEVIEAKQALQDAEARCKALAVQAALARSTLDEKRAQLVRQLRPELCAQLLGPLQVVIEGFQAATSAERLCGAVPGHTQGRQVVTALLSYFTAVHDHLQGDK